MLERLLLTKRDVGLRTVDNLIAANEMHERRIGRRVLISHKKVEQFIRRDHPTRSKSMNSETATDRPDTGYDVLA